MANHTPGPWTADVGETAVVRDHKRNQLAMFTHLHTRTGGRRDSDEVAANARLAAAAPDLYEALWIATEHAALYFGENHNTVIGGRAALAKAMTPHQKLSGEPT